MSQESKLSFLLKLAKSCIANSKIDLLFYVVLSIKDYLQEPVSSSNELSMNILEMIEIIPYLLKDFQMVYIGNTLFTKEILFKVLEDIRKTILLQHMACSLTEAKFKAASENTTTIENDATPLE